MFRLTYDIRDHILMIDMMNKEGNSLDNSNDYNHIDPFDRTRINLTCRTLVYLN